MKPHFRYDDPSDGENVLVVAFGDDGVGITVSEEHAVDSYNETFQCSITLPIEQAKILRDRLIEALDTDSKP